MFRVGDSAQVRGSAEVHTVKAVGSTGYTLSNDLYCEEAALQMIPPRLPTPTQPSRVGSVPELAEQVATAAAALQVDWAGHNLNYASPLEAWPLRLACSDAETWLAGDPAILSISQLRPMHCINCEEKVFLQVQGGEATATTGCPSPEGPPALSVELNLPSGQLLVGDSLPALWAPIPPLPDRPVVAYLGLVQAEGEFASFSGDLWLCDRSDALRRGFAEGDVLPMAPGVYRIHATGGTLELAWDRPAEALGPHPYPEPEVSPGAFLQHYVQRDGGACFGRDVPLAWDALSEDQMLWAWVNAANMALCVGSEVWHPDGFPLGAMPTEEVPLPTHFRFRYAWHPYAKDSPLCCQPLTTEFARLALRILESIISMGLDLDNEPELRVRARMLGAVQRYREILAKYPWVADPTFAAWVLQPGRAENWVNSFVL